MWYVLKRDYFDLLINYIARSYNYPYSYDNFGYFKNFTFYLWDDSEINYKSIKLSEEEILKAVNIKGRKSAGIIFVLCCHTHSL